MSLRCDDVAGRVLGRPSSSTLVGDLRRIRDDWHGTVKARSDSAVWRLADLLIRRPVVNARVVADELGIKVGNVYRYVKTLTQAGILLESSDAKHLATFLDETSGVISTST